MLLGITTIGWALYLVVFVPVAAGIVIAIDFVLRRVVAAPRFRAVVLAPVAISIIGYPVLEAQYSEWQMRKACPEAPGLVVYQRVVVPGYFDEEFRAPHLSVDPERDPELMARAVKAQKGTGYRFVEFEAAHSYVGGGLLRLELTPDDKIRLVKLDRPTARYRYTRTKESVIGLHVLRSEQYIMDTETGKPIASDIRVYRKASFIDRFWLRFLGPAENVAGCRLPSTIGFSQEFKRILIPIDKQH